MSLKECLHYRCKFKESLHYLCKLVLNFKFLTKKISIILKLNISNFIIIN